MFMGWKTRYSQDSNSPQTDLQIQCNPDQNTSKIFIEINKLILKFMWKCQGPRRAKTTLKKINEAGGLTQPDFKLQ